jgi:hypothetical protein
MSDYVFIDQDIDKLRSEMATNKNEFLVRLLKQCESYFEVVLPDEHPSASTTFMGMAVANLSLAFLLTKEQKYLDESKRWIFTCVKYPHWGNAHLVDVDLSAAWILFGLGIGYDWLKEDLSQEERALLRDKIILQGTRMYDFKIENDGHGWSTNYWQNHNWINLTGLATAGYGLVDECPEVQKWIDEAKSNFDFVYKVMPEDGSDYEGVVYWRYGAMWLFVYAHLIKEREGINYFQTCDFLKNTFYYRLYQAAPNLEEQINFGDCHDRRSGHSTAIYYKTAAEYKNGHAQKLANMVRTEFLERENALSNVKPGILPECFFEVLFYDATVEEEEFDNLDLVKYFEDLGLVIMRSSWEKEAIHFSFKTSYPGGKKQWDYLWKLKKEKNYDCFGLSHQHPDNNSFILNAFDKYFAIDDGYNRTVKASDHNVVIVDGKGYTDENQNNIWKNYTQDIVAEIEKFRNEPSYTYVVGETSKMYQKDLNLTRFARHVLNTKKPYFIMLDELASDDEHIYTWIMHSDVHPKVSGNLFMYEIEDAQMALYNVSPIATDYELLENNVRAVMTTQEPDKFRETNMKTIHTCNKEAAKEFKFLHVLIPGKMGDNKYQVKQIDLETAFGVEVVDGNESEVFLFAKENKVAYNNQDYNCKAILARLKGQEVIEVIEL